MAANRFSSGTSDAIIDFERPVNHFNIYIAAGVVFSFSVDGGADYMTLPVGFHSFPVGSVKEIRIEANGEWQLIAVQA